MPLAISPAVFPWVHRAPVGRLQVAQAMEDGMTLLTVDAGLKQWGWFVKVV